MLPQPCVAVEKSEEKKNAKAEGKEGKTGAEDSHILRTRQLRWMDSVCAQVELGPVQGRFTQF